MADNGVMVIYASETVPENRREDLRQFMKKLAEGAWKDFKMTNQSTVGKGLKFGAGIIGAAPVAKVTNTHTPLGWLFRKFGPLPMEYTSKGTIQVFELSKGQRAIHMLKAAGFKFILVTAAYEGGVLAGSITNQFLSSQQKDAIGGTINEIINHEGWKELWRHPFGIGLW